MTEATTSDAILRVEDLHVHFSRRTGFARRVGWFSARSTSPRDDDDNGATGPAAGVLRAVDGVSFTVRRGASLGLVGESGCGKSTLSRAILRLIPATGGRVSFENRDLFSLNRAELRAVRRRLQIVFQDPFGSLNPRLTVETILGEALHAHGLVRSARQRRDRVAWLLERVGLVADMMFRHPHEFSGGQRQRIGIARALSLEPRLIICDEPVSALDVSVQAQILNLLTDLQRELGLSYLFISHHLGVVRHMCDEIAVMRRGRIVEHATTEEVINSPRSEYTRSLLHAACAIQPRGV